MSVTNFKKGLTELDTFDKKANKVLSKLFSTEEIIPTDATDTQLHKEFEKIVLNKFLKEAFEELPKTVQTKLLHLIASLHYASKRKTQTGGNDNDIIELPDIDRKPNTYLTKNLVYSVLGLFFGLFLLLVAKNMATSLGADYGLEINFTGFVGLFLNPVNSAKGTFQVVVNSLLEQTKGEVAHQVERVCGAAGGGWVNNILVSLQGPGQRFQCTLDVANKVMGSEMQLQQTKIVNNLTYITNMVRAGYGIACYSATKVVLIVEGENGNVKQLMNQIPGGKLALKLLGADAEMNTLAIENYGGKRKSKKARKVIKSKKARKAKKSKKARKVRKSKKSKKA